MEMETAKAIVKLAMELAECDIDKEYAASHLHETFGSQVSGVHTFGEDFFSVVYEGATQVVRTKREEAAAAPNNE